MTLLTSGPSGGGDPAVPQAAAATTARPAVAFTGPKANARVGGRIRVAASVARRTPVTRVEFRIDGTLRWTDRRRPYVMFGDRGTLDTATLSRGAHVLSITAVARSGARTTVTRRIRVVRTPAGVGGDAPGSPARPPSPAPETLRVTGQTASSIGVAWDPADAAAAYGAYLNGQLIASPTTTGYTFGGLSCGVTYRVLVDSVNAAGTRSVPVTILAATAACPPPSVFLAPTGSDADPCTSAAPCQSLDRGYHAAAPGAGVELAAGTYPGSTITPDASKSGATSRVVMAPAPGAAVTISGEVMVSAQHLELRGMTTAGGWQTDASAQDVVLRDLDSQYLFINSSQQVSVIGGRVGPDHPVGFHPQIAASTATPPRDILIEGVTFHDWRIATAGQHTECLQIGGGERITVRDSRFINCEATGNLHITHYGPPSPRTRDVTIENNFFSTTINGFYAIQAYAVDNLLIRNNSATQGFLVMPFPGDTIAGHNVRLVANLIPAAAWECASGVSYRSNVFFWGVSGQSAAKCDPSDTSLTGVSNPGFVDPGSLDLHIGAGSAAIGRGGAAEAAVTDIDGDPRTTGRDAGADER